MNREIKFRGWNGEKMLESQDLSQPSQYWSWLGRQDVVLMQYTGLKDKNGVEIYEGDIVVFYDQMKCENKEPYKVIWEDGGFIREIIKEIWSCENKKGLAQVVGSVIAVIGNIYQNSELLN